ncbi:MAG: lysophospholipase L1-like esterase [Kiritimatiellia bacterium]|jgi:lysophospholipase L1-like esterase
MKFTYNLLITLTCLLVLEVGFRALEHISPPREVDYGLGFDAESQLFTSADKTGDAMRTQPAKRESFIDQTFLRTKPGGTFRIVVMGGSSVHYLDPEFTLLEQELTKSSSPRFKQVEILNGGGHAYGTHRLVPLFHEMLGYEPDLLVLYTGHNEFEEVEQLNLSHIERLPLDRTLAKSAILRFIRDRKAAIEISRLEREHNQRLLKREEPVSDSNYARAWKYPFTRQDVSDRMEQYKRNLTLIIEAASSRHIPVLIGTVPSNVFNPYLPKESAAQYREVYQYWAANDVQSGLELARKILAETPGRHQSSDLENTILHQLAKEHSIPLVDVESLVVEHEPSGIPGKTLFEDHCHLNAKGRSVWIAGFKPVIQEAMRTTVNEE